MIIGTDITKTYVGEPILKNISFKIGNNSKVALVGNNGCGKSTLLKVIAGVESYDTGSLLIENEDIGYIPQEFDFAEEYVGEVIEKELENSWEFYKAEKIISELKFKNFDIYQTTKSLSEGQKMKLKVLQVLLHDPSFLLIDEPTNHLDIEGRMWFEDYIKNLNKTVLLISHDRQFLNNTVSEIWEIENKKLLIFTGNYDYYKQEKLRLINKWNDNYTRFIRKKAQLERLLKETQKRKAEVSAVKTRIKREINDNKKEKYTVKNIKEIDFGNGITHSKLMVRFIDVTKKFENTKVFDNLSFEIRGGEKIWLFGPNGGGKTTLVNLIMGFTKVSGGEIYVPENISVGYFAQKQAHLDQKQNIMDEFNLKTGCYYPQIFNELRKFNFQKDDLQKRVCDLSPGQRARFAFSIFAYKNYDMLVLDEPDNHLDIQTKEVLENSLKDYSGTLLLISHDRFFVERSGVSKMLNLKKGKLVEI